MKTLLKTVLLVLMYILALSATAQVRWITGRVTDNTGTPLAGVAVTAEGAQRGAVTDNDGHYRIACGEDARLTFRCLGYETRTAETAARTVVDIELHESVQELDDVVVTGYQTISRERATGSFDILSRAQLDKPAGNIAGRLIGSAAGIAASQDAYGNPIFEIRGRTSLSSAATQPLLVVDGFAIEGGFGSINPNDVASVTILKDAAAASIWGAKSANGVIVITTKNGRRNGSAGGATVSVDYSGFLKVSPMLDLDYMLSQASTDDIIDYEVNNFGRLDSSVWLSNYGETSPSGGVSRVYEYLNENRLGHISDEEMTARIDALRGLNNHGQIKRYFLQNPTVHQQNVSMSLATDRMQTMLSAMYQNNRLHYKKRDEDKYMINIRNRSTLFRWLDLTLNGSYTYVNKDNSGAGIPPLSPYEMITDPDGQPIAYSNNVSLNYLQRHVPYEKFPYADWSWNPLTDMGCRQLTTTSSNARLQLGLTFKIWQGLTVDSQVQYETGESHSRNYYDENAYVVRYEVNYYSTWDRETDEVTSNIPRGGILEQSRNRYDVLTIRNQLNFNRTFADRHSIALAAGIETIDRNAQFFSYPRTYGYNDNTLSIGNYPAGQRIVNWRGTTVTLPYLNNGFSQSTDRYFSAFGNLSYTYDDRYTLSGSMRTDASNLITDDPAYRYAPFWSVGASWQIANERFMEGVQAVDKLTLRLTYGYNGNVDKSTTFKPLVNISASPSITTGEHTGAMSSYGNPTLRWERTGTWDAGVDFSLWHGKLHGKLDIYSKRSVDLIANVSLPSVQGTNSMKLNNGEMSNRGFELEIGSTLRISKNALWTGSLALSYNRSRITHLQQKPSYAYQLVYYRGSSQTWLEGYDINSLWAYRYGGLRNGGSEASPAMKPTIMTKSGDSVFMDSWPSGEAEEFSYYMGTMTAPWNMSLNTSVRIRDFDLSLIITGKFGHKFARESFNYPSMSGRALPNAKYREVLDGDPDKIIPLPQTDIETRYYFWDRFYPYMSYLVESAAHLRLQEFCITYNVPLRQNRRAGVKTMQVFMQCNNPFSIYFNAFGEDPEFPRGRMRLQASYTLGLKCKF